jgi:hypothetical protein
MAYPDGTAWPITELLINGTWTDYSTRNRATGGTQGVAITRGRQNEQGRVSPQTSTFQLNTADGLFSTRNPNSPLYGQIPRNTQVRHRAGDGDNYLYAPFNDQGQFNVGYCSDTAALHITGDTEIRLDMWPHTWRLPAGALTMVLASRYTLTGNQRAWAVLMNSDGTLALFWTTDGTAATRVVATSTAPVPAASGRLSLKITLDVDNGASGWTVTFSTASSINGTYTTLGSPVTGSGVTSVFAATSALIIGTGADSAGIQSGGYAYGGKTYELQLRNGIGGSLVANPIYGTQSTLGTATFNDALGNTWKYLNSGIARSDRMRYVGELNIPALSWDQTGRDVYATVTSSGILARLQANGIALGSAMFRQFSKLSGVVGYWPFEDGAGAQLAMTPIAGASQAQLNGVTLGGSDQTNFPGSSGYVTFGAPTTHPVIIAKPKFSASTQTLFMMMTVRADAVATGDATIGSFYITGGTVRRVDVIMTSTGAWRFDFIAFDGSTITSSSPAYITLTDYRLRWISVNVLMTASGGTVSWYARWFGFGDTVFSGIGPATFSGSLGSWNSSSLTSRNSSGITNLRIAHLLLANQDVGFVSSTVQNAVNAYVGETAAARVSRLSTEQGVTTEIIGQWNRSAAMGYQLPDTFTNLIEECADADRAFLSESRYFNGLEFRCGSDVELRRDLMINYQAAELTAITPAEDGSGFQNDVTVSRKNGSSARKVITSTAYHQIGTADPPVGAGTVTGSGPSGGTYNVQSDSQLPDLAGWFAHTGSWDDARYPNLTMSHHRAEVKANTSLAERLRSAGLGDTGQITGPPSFLPPEPITFLIQGYTETLYHSLWDIVMNTSPGGPYRTGRYSPATAAPDVVGTARYTTAGSTLSSSVTSSATTLVVAYATAGDNWTTTAASYPFDIMIEGERITLTSAPGGTSSPQTFTGVTRSVNGIVKAHPAGAVVELFDTTYYAV